MDHALGINEYKINASNLNRNRWFGALFCSAVDPDQIRSFFYSCKLLLEVVQFVADYIIFLRIAT
jgi:hypothetical protein